ncbi:hypothetical protein [Mycolicibacterium porcinum]|nr:hypothetical protein [Mycolicibacterium porcinum]
MASLTLDHLCGGRHVLGLGVSGRGRGPAHRSPARVGR